MIVTMPNNLSGAYAVIAIALVVIVVLGVVLTLVSMWLVRTRKLLQSKYSTLQRPPLLVSAHGRVINNDTAFAPEKVNNDDYM